MVLYLFPAKEDPMRNLFNLDNPVVQFLARVGDLIIVNALFLICCVPLVTIGASIAAMHKVTQAIAFDEDNGIVKTFFRGFRENFRQATAAWLLMVVFAVSVACNYLIIAGFAAGNMALVLKWLLIVLSALVVILAAYLFPLLARYQNTLRQHAMNALILAVVKLPRTVGLVGLSILPVLIAVISFQTFLQTLIFWVVVGFGFTSYMSSTLLKPVFREMEDKTGAGVQVMT